MLFRISYIISKKKILITMVNMWWNYSAISGLDIVFFNSKSDFEKFLNSIDGLHLFLLIQILTSKIFVLKIFFPIISNKLSSFFAKSMFNTERQTFATIVADFENMVRTRYIIQGVIKPLVECAHTLKWKVKHTTSTDIQIPRFSVDIWPYPSSTHRTQITL